MMNNNIYAFTTNDTLAVESMLKDNQSIKAYNQFCVFSDTDDIAICFFDNSQSQRSGAIFKFDAKGILALISMIGACTHDMASEQWSKKSLHYKDGAAWYE